MAHKITLQASEHSFEANDGERLLDAALRQGLILPYGCRDGACGSCAATLVEGDIAYKDGDPPAMDPERPERILICQAVAKSDLVLEVGEVRESGEIEPTKYPCRVTEIEHLADDVVRLYLKLPANDRMQFLAGQYIDFLLKDGRRRAFSIANAPHDDEYIELHIRHVDGGEFTGFVFEQMKEKAIMRIEGPYGGFFLREESDRPMIFMGGGTGFAPLKGIIEHAKYIGDTRPMHLYWGTRARADLYLPDLPRNWADQYENFVYHPILSQPEDSDNWQGRTGWVHEAVLEDHPDMSGFDVYMSGPPVMIESAREAFLGAGLPEDRLFYDSFEYAADANKAAAE